jgi:ABC-type nitrate/sulfonate/bicarbonate transport system substrate-binding protein
MKHRQEKNMQYLTTGSAISRRRFLGGMGTSMAGIAAAAALGPRLIANPRLPEHFEADNTSLGTVTLAFSWLYDVQQAGSYIAQQRGYYSPVKVNFLPGGDSYAGEPLVVAGKAICAMTSPTTTAAANNQGADLVLVGAQYQNNPFCVMSLKNKFRLTSPQDLAGKSVGYGANMTIPWNAFLKVNNLTGKVTSVLTSRNATILTSGDVDAYVGWITSDAISLEVAGESLDTLLFGDWGLKEYSLTYCVQKAALNDSSKRAQIKAMLTGEIRGWEADMSDPALGLNLTLDDWGKNLGLNKKQQQLQGVAQITDLISSATTKAHGIFWMSDSDIDKVLKTLSLSEIHANQSLFDNSLLKEIYQGKTKIPL